MNLACLYLYENKITQIVNLDFAVNLTHLYIQDNKIAVMENLEPLQNLRKLFIGGATCFGLSTDQQHCTRS